MIKLAIQEIILIAAFVVCPMALYWQYASKKIAPTTKPTGIKYYRIQEAEQVVIYHAESGGNYIKITDSSFVWIKFQDTVMQRRLVTK